MRFTGLALSFFLICGSLFAEDVQLAGELHQRIQVPQQQAFNSASLYAAVQEVTLLDIKLSNRAVQAVQHRAIKSSDLDHSEAVNSSNGVNHIQLAMNDVPVLNQGRHGSCVTFAVTAAIDAIINKGDYVSQLCNLQLGQHLENMGYSLSGWAGSFSGVVLSQIDKFGVVNKSNEASVGCGGERAYPVNEMQPTTEMTLPEFHALSEPANKWQVAWSSLQDIYQFAFQETNTTTTLNQVKRALQEGERVTFGVFLADIDLGVVGAVGKYQTTYDTWVLSAQIMEDLVAGKFNGGGHAMVITGFDDNAVAIDDAGKRHKGLLTLRNSWGSGIGNNGDFYMSYDYFKVLVLEAQRIRKLKVM